MTIAPENTINASHIAASKTTDPAAKKPPNSKMIGAALVHHHPQKACSKSKIN
jgi:hypothetical protein